MLKRFGRGVWVLSSIFVIAYLIYVLLPLLYPFLLAWIIAYAMNPCVRLLQRSLKLPRWLAVMLSLLLYFGAALLILTAAVTRLVKELIILSQSFNLHIDAWMEWLTAWTQNDSFQNIINEISRFYQNNPNYHDTINQNITRTTQTIGTAVTDLVTGIFNGILQIIYYLPNLGTILIVVLLSTFFLSNSWERHNRALIRILPDVIRKPMIYIFTDLKSVVRIREGTADSHLHHGPDRHDHALCARGRFRLLHRSSDRLGGSSPLLGRRHRPDPLVAVCLYVGRPDAWHRTNRPVQHHPDRQTDYGAQGARQQCGTGPARRPAGHVRRAQAVRHSGTDYRSSVACHPGCLSPGPRIQGPKELYYRRQIQIAVRRTSLTRHRGIVMGLS